MLLPNRRNKPCFKLKWKTAGNDNSLPWNRRSEEVTSTPKGNLSHTRRAGPVGAELWRLSPILENQNPVNLETDVTRRHPEGHCTRPLTSPRTPLDTVGNGYQDQVLDGGSVGDVQAKHYCFAQSLGNNQTVFPTTNWRIHEEWTTSFQEMIVDRLSILNQNRWGWTSILLCQNRRNVKSIPVQLECSKEWEWCPSFPTPKVQRRCILVQAEYTNPRKRTMRNESHRFLN